MSWIKRNLGFVISSGLGLVLLGLSGWYLYSEMQANDTARAGFDGALTALRTAQTAVPFPNEKNLDLAKEDLKRATNMASQAKAIFLPFQHYSGYNDRTFKNYVEAQVFNMQQEAKQYGVTLPTDYYFTFGSLRKVMSFDQEVFPAWVEAMEEIKTLVDILIKARVNSIVGIRRSALAEIEGADYPDDFMNGVDTVTNLGVIRTPYEVTFSSFSGELANVVEGFMRSSNCFLLKNINVGPGQEAVVPFVDVTLPGLNPVIDLPPVATAAAAPPAEDAATRRRRQDMEFFRRYGQSRTRMTLPPPPAPVVPAAPVAPKVIPRPVTVLSERPLQVTIFLEILKLDTPPPIVKRSMKSSRPSAPNNPAGMAGSTNAAAAGSTAAP